MIWSIQTKWLYNRIKLWISNNIRLIKETLIAQMNLISIIWWSRINIELLTVSTHSLPDDSRSQNIEFLIIVKVKEIIWFALAICIMFSK